MDHRIGIIGAGAIVRSAHLPAYRAAGLKVTAIADANMETAYAAADEFDIPQVFAGASELIERADIDVVDIAVPPMDQRQIFDIALRAGKHMLCQKPLAWTLEDAVLMVRDARRANLRLAVNQQFRWSPLMRDASGLLRAGSLGNPELATFNITTSSDWTAWDWLVDQPRLDLIAHSIHYLDGLRFLFGEPRLVTSLGRKSPDQRAAGESITITTLDFGNLIAVLTVNHNVPYAGFARGEIRLSGPDGAFEGRLGLYSGLNFALDEPDQASWYAPGEEHPWRSLKGRWFPDAFAEPMQSLIACIDSGGEPMTSGQDNLLTLAVIFAGYRSMETGLAVSPQTVLAEAVAKADAEPV